MDIKHLVKQCESVANAKGSLKHLTKETEHGTYQVPVIRYKDSRVQITNHRWTKVLEVRAGGKVVLVRNRENRIAETDTEALESVRDYIDALYQDSGYTPYFIG